MQPCIICVSRQVIKNRFHKSRYRMHDTTSAKICPYSFFKRPKWQRHYVMNPSLCNNRHPHPPLTPHRLAGGESEAERGPNEPEDGHGVCGMRDRDGAYLRRRVRARRRQLYSHSYFSLSRDSVQVGRPAARSERRRL